MKKEEISVQDKISTLIVGILALTFVFGGYYTLKSFANKPVKVDISPVVNKDEIEEIKNANVELLSSLGSKASISLYQNGLITPISLIESCKDGSRIPDACGKEIANITKSISVSGNIDKAYLYIKAGVSRDGVPMGSLTQFDSIWFYIDSSSTGGHLLRSKALINKQTEDGLTELVFDLSQVPFVGLPYSENKNPEVKNLLDVLNSGENHITGSFVSSLGIGKLYEVKIFYEGGNLEIK